MSLVVHFDVTFRPDAIEPVEVLREVLRQTVRFEGFLDLQVLLDDADPSRVLSVITWEDDRSYDSYLAWRQTPEGATRLAEVLAGPPTVRRFSRRVHLDGAR